MPSYSRKKRHASNPLSFINPASIEPGHIHKKALEFFLSYGYAEYSLQCPMWTSPYMKATKKAAAMNMTSKWFYSYRQNGWWTDQIQDVKVSIFHSSLNMCCFRVCAVTRRRSLTLPAPKRKINIGWIQRSMFKFLTKYLIFRVFADNIENHDARKQQQ